MQMATSSGRPTPWTAVAFRRSAGSGYRYPGGRDVIGNPAGGQFQLDVFGEGLLLFAKAARLGRLDGEGRTAIEIAVKAITRRAAEPDARLWELEPRLWAHSRLICAAGLRAVATALPADHEAAEWETIADGLVDHARSSINPSGRWQRAPEDGRVDAALLTPAIRGAIPASDARSVATVDAVERELTDDGFVYRFRHDHRPLPEAEGAFLLCGYWMALARHQQGATEQARAWYERTRTAYGAPGLYAEEYDVSQRQLRGNLPQAFVHAIALECGLTLTHGMRGLFRGDRRGETLTVRTNTLRGRAMPEEWTDKQERKYTHIVDSEKDQGRSTKRAKEIAARTVNKERAQKGQTKSASRSSTNDMSSAKRGGQRSGTSRAKGRTKEQLYNEARQRGVKGRSSMNKEQLRRAVDAKK